jgi:DNA adenine methylase
MSVLKWVGGKAQLMKEIIKYIPERVDTYYEPFIGGASVLIELLELNEKGEVVINNFIVNDINVELINLYKNIMFNHSELINYLDSLSNEFKALPEEKTERHKKIIPPEHKEQCDNRKVFYYWVRKEYNKLKKNSATKYIEKSAYFIFLNKVGFRGLYRENTNSEFNVPYGNNKNPKILNGSAIERLNYLFNKYDVKFINLSFEMFMGEFKLHDRDFIYIDPPYYPINDNSFTAYSAVDFGLSHHKDLINLLNDINNIGTKFLMSNSYTDWIINHTEKFKSKKINCRRRINSKNPESMEFEILVFN